MIVATNHIDECRWTQCVALMKIAMPTFNFLTNWRHPIRVRLIFHLTKYSQKFECSSTSIYALDQSQVTGQVRFDLFNKRDNLVLVLKIVQICSKLEKKNIYKPNGQFISTFGQNQLGSSRVSISFSNVRSGSGRIFMLDQVLSTLS